MEHLEIKLPEKYKNVINDATIEIVDCNIIITPKKQEFKVGDICILWDNNKNKSIVSTIYEIDLLHPMPYVSPCGRFYNAIKCTSL